MGWILHSQDKTLPEWLRRYLNESCEYCGSEKENFYNEKGECTNRRCPNQECPGTLARKFGAMASILRWKGLSDKTGLKYIKTYNLKTHFEVIPYVMRDKPTISLYELFRICFIPGVDTGWGSVVGAYDSVQEVLSSYQGSLRKVLIPYEETVLAAEQYFNIRKQEKLEYEPIITGNVMLSGSIKGLNDRNSLVYGINRMSCGLIQLTVVGKRKTNVMCLVQESDAPHGGKAEVAIENSIPIWTPDEFRARIREKLEDKLKEARMI